MLKFHDGMFRSDYMHAIEFHAQGGIIPLTEWVTSEDGVISEIRREGERAMMGMIG